MKTLNFWQGVFVALTASLLGSIVYFALSNLFSADCGIRLVISGLALAYSLYLLSCSRERTGRITFMLVFCIAIALLWLLYPALSLCFWQVLAIWLMRSLYCHSGLLASLADLGLSMLSLAAAFWTLGSTGNLFLSIWCFFLTQALFVFIPERSNLDQAASPDTEADFKRAYQAAEAAVRKLSSQV